MQILTDDKRLIVVVILDDLTTYRFERSTVEEYNELIAFWMDLMDPSFFL